MRLLAISILSLLLLAPNAQAQEGALDRAAESLTLDPVYVDPDAEGTLSDSEADDLRAAIGERDAGPLYIVVLPVSAAREAGGDAGAALREIALAVDEPGTYAAVVGRSFRAGSRHGVLREGVAPRLATEAFEAERSDGIPAVLEDFVRRVGDAKASGGGDASEEDGGGFPWFLVALAAIPAALFVAGRRRRRRREQEEFEQVRGVAREDVLALGEDIRALDIDVEMPGVDPVAKEHYGLAVERYSRAEELFDRARRPEDMKPVTELLEEGRWAMEVAKAQLAGRPAPERRAPCFFDPRHGPSVSDVEWAPDGGQPRPVPACAADAARIEKGDDPNVRQVAMDGRLVPYWQAGPAFAPWAGGFFGGGLLPGLFIGSTLGGGFGAPGDAWAGEGGQGGDFDDFGGDFGGGMGDFGGGGDF